MNRWVTLFFLITVVSRAEPLSPQIRLELRSRCFVWNPDACNDQTRKADAELKKSLSQKERPTVAAERISKFAWIVLKDRKAPELALKRFNQAAILDPLAADPWHGAGESYLALDMEEEAEKAFAGALKLGPRSTGIRLSWAHLKAKQGKLEEAEKLAQQALDLEPKSFSTALYLAQLLARQTKLEDGKRVYRRALALGAKPNAELERLLK